VFNSLSTARLRVFDLLGNGPFGLSEYCSAESFNGVAHR
jgi:hypothetical protein